MILFWLIVAVMIALAIAAVAPALLGRARPAGTDYTATNLAVYRDRLAELQAERDDGTLAPEQYQVARAELERDLAREVPAETESRSGGTGSGGRWPLGALVVAVPLVTLAFYMGLGRPDLLAEPPSVRIDPAQAGKFMRMDPAKRIPALEEYLADRPNAGEGWWLLGQAYQSRSQYGDAVEAYGRAHDLIGDEPNLLVNYAEAIAQANDRQLTPRAIELANRALELDPDNRLGLWLAGSGALGQGNDKRATSLWRRLARKFPAGSESERLVKGAIARAEGVSPAEVTIDRPGSEAAGPRLSVRVALAPDLADQAAPEDTVFIFARSPEGPPIPVAAVRKQVADLPVTVTLSDAQAMVPERTLSQLDRVVVGARISKSGRAIAQSGDLQGLSDPVPVAETEKVRVTIDTDVP